MNKREPSVVPSSEPKNTMKTKSLLAFLAVSLATLGGLATSASAHTDLKVGVVFRSHRPVVVNHHDNCAPSHGPDRYDRGHGRQHAHGYWKVVTVKAWVPAGWVSRYDHHGREFMVYQHGHYTYRTERVWVDLSHDRGNHYGRR